MCKFKKKYMWKLGYFSIFNPEKYEKSYMNKMSLLRGLVMFWLLSKHNFISD